MLESANYLKLNLSDIVNMTGIIITSGLEAAALTANPVAFALVFLAKSVVDASASEAGLPPDPLTITPLELKFLAATTLTEFLDDFAQNRVLNAAFKEVALYLTVRDTKYKYLAQSQRSANRIVAAIKNGKKAQRDELGVLAQFFTDELAAYDSVLEDARIINSQYSTNYNELFGVLGLGIGVDWTKSVEKQKIAEQVVNFLMSSGEYSEEDIQKLYRL